MPLLLSCVPFPSISLAVRPRPAATLSSELKAKLTTACSGSRCCCCCCCCRRRWRRLQLAGHGCLWLESSALLLFLLLASSRTDVHGSTQISRCQIQRSRRRSREAGQRSPTLRRPFRPPPRSPRPRRAPIRPFVAAAAPRVL